MRILRSVVLAILLCLFCGCGTLMRGENCQADKRFLATRIDYDNITGHHNEWTGGIMGMLIPIFILDIPFAVAMDIILYPADSAAYKDSQRTAAFWNSFFSGGDQLISQEELKQSHLWSSNGRRLVHFSLSRGDHKCSNEALMALLRAMIQVPPDMHTRSAFKRIVQNSDLHSEAVITILATANVNQKYLEELSLDHKLTPVQYRKLVDRLDGFGGLFRLTRNPGVDLGTIALLKQKVGLLERARPPGYSYPHEELSRRIRERENYQMISVNSHLAKDASTPEDILDLVKKGTEKALQLAKTKNTHGKIRECETLLKQLNKRSSNSRLTP